MKSLFKTLSQLQFVLVLVILSTAFYVQHYCLFHDAHHIFLYLVSNIAFVFIEVLIVTLIIDRILHDREKRAKIKKLNMVIGVFFSEVGNPLLKTILVYFRGMVSGAGRMKPEGSIAGSNHSTDMSLSFRFQGSFLVLMQ